MSEAIRNRQKEIRGRRRLPALLASCFLLLAQAIPAPALADGASCWCRNQAWVCSHYTAAQVIPGGTSGDMITEEQCRTFCEARDSRYYLQARYTTADATTLCQENCVQGSSCSASGITGVRPAELMCIVRMSEENSRGETNVASLVECCELNRVAGVWPERVGYSGSIQGCPADPGSAPGTSATATGPIRLFNPLGAETDIPAFIGRGIRGVLGVIGAIALLMFVYGGVVWMTAGDSKRVDDAKNIIKNSVIGLLLIFFSYSLIGIFFDLFT